MICDETRLAAAAVPAAAELPANFLRYATLVDILRASACSHEWSSVATAEQLWMHRSLGLVSRGDEDVRDLSHAALRSVTSRWLCFMLASGAAVFPPPCTKSTLHVQERQLQKHTLRVLQLNPDALRKGDRAMPRADRDAIVGLRVWISCPLMCWYFARRPETVRGRRVCCLGEGVGLLGISLAQHSPSYTLLTDGSALCTSLMKANGVLNGLSAAFDVFEHNFGRLAAQGLLQSERVGNKRFDVVTASDVVYGRSSPAVDALFESVDVLLAHSPGAAFYHGYTERRPELTAVLLKSAEQHGFQCEQLPLWEKGTPDLEAFLLPGERRAVEQKPTATVMHRFTRRQVSED